MNKDGVNEYSSCSAFFESMKSAGYETILQGSAQGGIQIAEDTTISLKKHNGLPEVAVRAALNNGASDHRLGIAALLARISDSHNLSNHRDAQSRIQVANDVMAPPGEKPGTPSLD